MASDQITTWPELAMSLYENLTSRGATITYAFDNLEVFVPAEHSEDAALARWRINGAVSISTSQPASNAD